jgi:hypothetical protein
MKGALVRSVFLGLLAMAGTVNADVVPVNPTNDPNGQTIVGMGVERLAVQHCGKQKDISQILPITQGKDTFDIQHRFLKFNETGASEWVDLQLTGGYSWLKDTMFLSLDDISRTALLNLIQLELTHVCQNDATLIPRSITITKNEVKISGKKRVNGVLQVKAKYVAHIGNVSPAHNTIMGDVTYTLQLKGGLN